MSFALSIPASTSIPSSLMMFQLEMSSLPVVELPKLRGSSSCWNPSHNLHQYRQSPVFIWPHFAVTHMANEIKAGQINIGIGMSLLLFLFMIQLQIP
jgi:hypothetical protein